VRHDATNKEEHVLSGREKEIRQPTEEEQNGRARRESAVDGEEGRKKILQQSWKRRGNHFIHNAESRQEKGRSGNAVLDKKEEKRWHFSSYLMPASSQRRRREKKGCGCGPRATRRTKKGGIGADGREAPQNLLSSGYSHWHAAARKKEGKL